MLSDLNSFIMKLKEEKLLVEIEEPVNWELEAGALCTMTNRVGGPALYFKNIKGYPEGFTMVGSLFSGPGNLHTTSTRNWSRMALAMDLDKNILYEELCEELITRTENQIMPIELDTGPCKEVIEEGDDADVTKFPIPRLHGVDGGRYGTLAFVLAKDPDTGWQNWGIYRWMVKGPRTLVGHFPTYPLMPKGKHFLQILDKYEKRGEPMPFCIVVGGPPTLAIAAAMNAPVGTDEANIASGLALDPVQLVKAESSNILVPADAEVVIEGEVLPGERDYEGPFPEYHRVSPKTLQPLLRVKLITHKKNPIWSFAVEGSRVSDSMTLLSVIHSCDLLKASKLGFVHTRWINLPVESKLGWCIVSTNVPYNGYTSRFAKFLFSVSPYKWFDKILVVDTDVEPVDLGRCLNDMCQKVHPIRDIRKGEEEAPIPMSAAYPCPEGKSARLIVDATWPVGFDKSQLPERTAFEVSFPPEIQKSVIERWLTDFGFEKKPIVETHLIKKLGISRDLVY